MDLGLSGRVAIVTGASRGIGNACAAELAAEGAQHGIRANSISPGVIAIPAVQAQIDLLGDDAPMMSMVRTTADGRPGQPEDIAYAALFLASDEARFINGET